MRDKQFYKWQQESVDPHSTTLNWEDHVKEFVHKVCKGEGIKPPRFIGYCRANRSTVFYLTKTGYSRYALEFGINPDYKGRFNLLHSIVLHELAHVILKDLHTPRLAKFIVHLMTKYQTWDTGWENDTTIKSYKYSEFETLALHHLKLVGGKK